VNATPSDQSTPLVSVIIPVLNDPKRLGRCLEALRRQTYPPDRYEIIVVDNGSDPPLFGVEEQGPRVTYLSENKRSSYAARNRGVMRARGTVIAFTDADCIPDTDWIERGVGHLLTNLEPGLVAGRIQVFCRRPGRPNLVEAHDLAAAFPQKKYVETGHYGATANVFTLKSVFEAVGPFYEGTASGGDFEWGKRVFASGRPLRYADDVVVRHPARRTLGQLLHKSRFQMTGVYTLIRVERQGRPPRLRTFVRAFLPPVLTAGEVLRDPRGRGFWFRVGVAGLIVLRRYAMALRMVTLLLQDIGRKRKDAPPGAGHASV